MFNVAIGTIAQTGPADSPADLYRSSKGNTYLDFTFGGHCLRVHP